eukprot:GHVU01067445.1.p1 GENE.GHVU01067445.1~~GHVU01067445.1.p1  ORF type:complete len:186 (-),score=26.63 GHVU01067445.1:326-883(-)
MRSNECESVLLPEPSGRPSRGASGAGRAADAGPWVITAGDPDEVSGNLDDVEAADAAEASAILAATAGAASRGTAGSAAGGSRGPAAASRKRPATASEMQMVVLLLQEKTLNKKYELMLLQEEELMAAKIRRTQSLDRRSVAAVFLSPQACAGQVFTVNVDFRLKCNFEVGLRSKIAIHSATSRG